MDDQFLRDLKAQPNPEFAARLRATLRTVPPHAVARVAPAAWFRKWFAAAASIAVVGFAFTLPPVQAAAEAFLDLFRVRNFTGVYFDRAQHDALRALSDRTRVPLAAYLREAVDMLLAKYGVKAAKPRTRR